MSTDRFTAAMGYIDDDLISDAVTYMPKNKEHKFKWMKVVAVAACICLVVATIFPLFQEDGGSPFVLTAYALESDNTVSSVEMKEGENIPVSFFEADNGLKGFIFSYNADEPKEYYSFSIMTDGTQGTIDQQIEAINGLELSKDNFYVFYIPSQDQPAPYRLPLTMEDEATNTIAMLNVVIEENNEGYIARIDSISIHEKRTEPPK